MLGSEVSSTPQSAHDTKSITTKTVKSAKNMTTLTADEESTTGKSYNTALVL